MRYRQVHLDFHTSKEIEEIGKEFDKKAFQEALKEGHIDSVTLFSKCHHGWAYHPSKANEMHPHLKFDLLGAQIEAAHEIGVKTPVYLSAGLDEKMARRHPEWLVVNYDGSFTWAKTFLEPGYHKFCMNTPYLPYLLEQIKEVCENYDADGIFLDIANVQPCYCNRCLEQMKKEGLDPEKIEDVTYLAERVYANYTKQVRETIDSVKPGLSVFHNGGHIRRGRRDLAKMNTHLEIESLPTGGWGYDHFPLSAAYARTIGMEYLGMTGKFHTAWGEFGGFKHPNALRYEVALSAANGAACSIGDQLHPSGKMNPATYKLIGAAYAELEQKEPWIKGAKNIADVAVLSTESVGNDFGTGQIGTTGEADAGASRILLEGHYLFDVVDLQADFSAYKVLILPDTILLDEELENKLASYVQSGGKILATGMSGVRKNNNQFGLDFGAQFKGECEYRPSYFRPLFEIEDWRNTEFVLYSQGYEIVCEDAANVLGMRQNPYFNRTAAHFSSHQHTPNDFRSEFPAMVQADAGIYIGWQVFTEYAQNGSLILKRMVQYALDTLLGPGKTVKTDLGAQGVVTLSNQENRWIAHLLYAVPVKRGKGVEIIEDIEPVYEKHITVRTPQIPREIYLAPDRERLCFVQENGGVTITVPKFENHAMVVLEW